MQLSRVKAPCTFIKYLLFTYTAVVGSIQPWNNMHKNVGCIRLCVLTVYCDRIIWNPSLVWYWYYAWSYLMDCITQVSARGNLLLEELKWVWKTNLMVLYKAFPTIYWFRGTYNTEPNLLLWLNLPPAMSP